MAQLTIYVDRDLERRIRRCGIPVSAVCQTALRAELERIDRATARRRQQREIAKTTPPQTDDRAA